MNRRWIKHKGKMVATTFPEGVTPANWNEKYPPTFTGCGSQNGGFDGTDSNGHPYQGANQLIPTYLRIVKGMWPFGQSYYTMKYQPHVGYQQSLASYSYSIEGEAKVNGQESILTRHSKQTHAFGNITWNNEIECISPEGRVFRWTQKKYVMGGQPWIDETGEVKVNGQTYDEYHTQMSKQDEGEDFNRRVQREKDENKTPSETDVAYHTRMKKMWEQTGGAEAERYVQYHSNKVQEYTEMEKREDENMNRMSNQPNLMSFAEQSYMRW